MFGEFETADKRRIVVGTIDFRVMESLKTQLDLPEYVVRFVPKAVDVLNEILDNDVDLLILDLDLAGIMGIEILPIVKRLRPRLPIILVSDDYTERLRKIAGELGIRYHAYKPMTSKEAESIALATEKIVHSKVEQIVM